MKKLSTMATLMMTSTLALAASTGCIVDEGDDGGGYESEVAELDQPLSAPAECEGYTCKVTGQAWQGSEVRVSCEGTHTVMVFCYSTEGECGPNPPNTGDEVCLADAPDGTNRQETECLNDPCCEPCPDDDAADAE